jgi:hypothetical protein
MHGEHATISHALMASLGRCASGIGQQNTERWFSSPYMIARQAGPTSAQKQVGACSIPVISGF